MEEGRSNSDDYKKDDIEEGMKNEINLEVLKLKEMIEL